VVSLQACVSPRFPLYARRQAPQLMLPDAVVVWDWLISLPREWRFVRLLPFCLFALLTSRSDLEDHLDARQSCIPFLSVRSRSHAMSFTTLTSLNSYWVIAVVPYLLFAFVTNHTLEVCERIYKVGTIATISLLPHETLPDSCGIGNVEPSRLAVSVLISSASINSSQIEPILAVLLIRTYAFFNRNVYILVGLVCALAGVVAYQLYVDTSQMWRKFR
jgi:hypothetical protein